MAWIALDGMEIKNAPIGYYDEEKQIGNNFRVSVWAELDIVDPDADELANTLNYETLYEVVQEVMSQKMDLIETAAHRVYKSLTEKNVEFNQLRIEIRKYKPMLVEKGGDSVISMNFQNRKNSN